MVQSLIDKAGIKHTQEEWKKGGKTGSNPWLHSEDLNWEGWKDWAGDVFVGVKDYTYKGLPEDATYKDYMFELQKSRQPEQYNSPGSFERGSDAEGQKILADINKKFPDRKKDDAYTGPLRHKGEKGAEGLEIKEALRKGQFTKDKREYEEAKKKAEEKAAFLDTPKGRMQTMWNDADKRDAILGGIADAMLETRTGVEAYGSRISQAQKNVRQNLKIAEATDIARAQAALDMQKTAAETNKLNNPAQFMSDTQKEASSIASMEHRLGSPGWKEKYAAELRRIAYKDMLSGPVDGIMAISEYMMKMPNIDPTMKQIYTDIINQLMGTIQGATGGDVTASTTAANTLTHPDLKK